MSFPSFIVCRYRARIARDAERIPWLQRPQRRARRKGRTRRSRRFYRQRESRLFALLFFFLFTLIEFYDWHPTTSQVFYDLYTPPVCLLLLQSRIKLLLRVLCLSPWERANRKTSCFFHCIISFWLLLSFILPFPNREFQSAETCQFQPRRIKKNVSFQRLSHLSIIQKSPWRVQREGIALLCLDLSF